MKFYHLPRYDGFLSMSKNHFTLYNESQTAIYKFRLTLYQFNDVVHYCQNMKSMQDNIIRYQENKNKTFQELGFPGSHWTIK